MKKAFYTYGPAIYLLMMIAIIVFSITSCSSGSSTRESYLHKLQTEGLDRLMVEECGDFLIDYDKHVAIDTTLKKNRLNRHLRIYKLNADSTRYVLCK